MNLRRAVKILWSPSALKSRTLPCLKGLDSWLRWVAHLLQKKRKCETVSGAEKQCWQVGDSASLNLCRYAWSGMWFVRSCVRMLTRNLGSLAVILRNLLDGMEGSNATILWYL